MKPSAIPVALVSLGCPKNLVDSEHMSGILQEDGFVLTADPASARVIIVNTCGFIDSAKQEAIETILNMADYKEAGSCDYLVVTGCMSQRYGEQIRIELPEVDAVLGTSQYARVAEVVRALYTAASGSAGSGPLLWTDFDPDHTLDQLRHSRNVSTGSFAYLKVAEGCSSKCTYCAIPGIRGPQVSRPMEELLEEARRLEQAGIAEIVLIAQDTTAYGLDLYGERRLAELLQALDQMDFQRVRFLYAYSDGVSDELLSVMAAGRHLVHYLDLPIQHAADGVLKRMGRRDNQKILRDRLSRARALMPDISLRTTVMVGFPGETDEDVSTLLSFMEEISFDHLGCFIFSPEEGTAAVRLPDPVPAQQSAERYNQVMALQRQLRQQKDRERIGEVWPVLVDDVSEDGIFYLGRAPWQAPEIDSKIYLLASTGELSVGQMTDCRIVEAGDYDFTGVSIHEPAE